MGADKHLHGKKLSDYETEILVNVRKNGNYIAHLGSGDVHQITITEYALHVWRIGLDSASTLSHIDYFYNSLLCSKFSAATDATFKVPKFFYQKSVFETHAAMYEENSMLRPDH